MNSPSDSLQQAFPIHGEEIRVVELLPGTDLDAISLECRIITLDGGRNFEALSYVWGDMHTMRNVEISGYNVEITQPLYVAFQNLRDVHEKRTLWVDQVCINQSDDVEKSHQVSLMRTIYRKCSQCVIWLGEIPSDRQFSASDAKVAMDFVHIMAYDKSYLTKVQGFVTDDEHGKRARKAFEALIMGGNPWWSRVWTLQEASLPYAATLQWGPLTLPLKTIELAAFNLCQGWLCEIPSKEVAAEYEQLTRNFLYPVRGLSIARSGESPLNALMRWRYRQATDPRDKVYGLAGLLPSNSLSGIPSLRDVDYNVTSPTLFTRVTLDLIRFDKDLRSLVGARELRQITPEIPSWAIDFASSSAIGKRQTKWWQHSHRYLRWTASKGLDFRLETSENNKSLLLSGILIDRVQKVSGVYHVSIEDEIDDEKLRENIVQSRHLLNEHRTFWDRYFGTDYVSGGTLEDAFWRTMLGNLIMAETPKGVPKYYHMDDFEAYIGKGTHSRLTLSLYGLVPNHAFFITTKGYIGMGSPDVREGDEVRIFGGGRVPFVIRSLDNPPLEKPAGEIPNYHLICDAYVHGVMRGEAVIEKKEEVEVIKLV